MHTFETPQPVDLTVRIGRGSVAIGAGDVTRTTITLDPLNDAGREAVERARVEQSGRRVLVDLPRHPGGFLRQGAAVAVTIEVPADSALDVRSDSADLVAKGRFARADCATGSGDVDLDDVTGSAQLKSGSGRLACGRVLGTLRAGTGSGDVHVDETGSAATLSSGSGDLSIGELHGTVSFKTGSGDVEIGVLDGDLLTKTGSGDLIVRRARSGRLRSTGGTGDITLGVVEGTAAWLDVSTVNGHVTQELGDRAAPREDQPTVEVTAHTVSGDVRVHRA